ERRLDYASSRTRGGWGGCRRASGAWLRTQAIGALTHASLSQTVPSGGRHVKRQLGAPCWYKPRRCCIFRHLGGARDMAIVQTELAGLRLHGRGKVRDIYDLGDHYLIVASDRLSAFDVVLPTPIPNKGKVLTQMSEFWFEHLKDVVPHHLVSTRLEDFPPDVRRHRAQVQGRSMLVRKATVFPIECVVRGYLAGSGLKDYQKSGAVCGIALPAGLRESDRLPEPIFTPATKAEVGLHDENISEAEAGRRIGADTVQRLKALSLEIYRRASAYAARRGILVCDTKFEFGLI